MNRILCSISCFIIFTINVLAQSSTNKQAPQIGNIKWSVNPFEQSLFVENKGQFDDVTTTNKILFEAKLGNVNAYFTPTGIIYRFIETEKPVTGEDPDQNGPPKRTFHYLTCQWENANNNVSIITGQKQSYYYTYPNGMQSTYMANVFKKITYSNIYPGIDIIYSFKNNNLEYSIIVHPGADLNNVHLKYNKISEMQATENGGSIILNDIGILRESAPVSYYEENHNKANVLLTVNKPEESFVGKNIDPTKTLIIDPVIQWDSGTGFSVSSNYAYDLGYDNYGNVYVYGGGPSPLQLSKLDSTGAIKWVFNATLMTSSTNFFGDFAVDKHSSECYVVEGWNAGGGARVEKISPIGALMATCNGATTFNEMWRIKPVPCSSSLVIFGGGTCCPDQAAILDTNLVSITPVNILGPTVTTGYHDIALATVDPFGGNAWVATTQSLVYKTVYNNTLVKLPLPALTPYTYAVPDHFAFDEIGSMYYVAGLTFNAMNGMACSQQWLYAYNGDTIKQINKSTGAITLSVKVSSTPYAWGGLDVDMCGNVYAAVNNIINVYDSNINLTYTLPTLPGTIYDLAISNYPSQLIYACGQGFVASIGYGSSPPPAAIAITKLPSSCFSCSGSAKATLNFCGNADPAVTYLWSDGETTQTATSLCPGVDTVTITVACGIFYKDTVNIATGTVVTINSTNDTDACDGSAWVNVLSGNPPYTFQWSPGGQTTDTIQNLCAGTYCCKITDHTGCSDSICTTVNRTCTYYTPSICYVTSDTLSHHNIVVWEKTGLDSTKVDSFIVYRGVTSHIYNRIGAVSIHNYTSYTDTGSNPNLTSYDYKLGISETCGIDTTLSIFHQTVLLQSNIGLHNVVNLSWDLYQGVPVNYYRILRDDSGNGNWHVLDSVAGTINVYTDLTAPSSPGLRYMLNTNWNVSCTPYIPTVIRSHRRYILITKNESYSNITVVIPTGIAVIENPMQIDVYPNPANDELFINIIYPFDGTMSLSDVLGRQVYIKEISIPGNNHTEQLDLKPLSSGVYFLNMTSKQGQRLVKKVIKL